VRTIALSGFLSLTLGACSTATVAQSAVGQFGAGADNSSSKTFVADSSSGSSPSVGLISADGTPMNLREESELVFNILAAEIAGRRGMVEIASENYFDASTATNDPRVSERAVKLALYARDWQRADLASARWVELAPENVEAWQHRAQASMQRKDIDTATAAMEQVVALSDGNPGEVIPALVDSILRQSDADIGSQLLERLAARYPDNAETQYGIGRFAMSKGEREIALQAFERALAIDPDNVDTLLSRARLQLRKTVDRHRQG